MTDNSRPLMPEDDSELPGNPGATLPQYKQLMQRCWAPNARERPTFKQIVDYFQVGLVGSEKERVRLRMRRVAGEGKV